MQNDMEDRSVEAFRKRADDNLAEAMAAREARDVAVAVADTVPANDPAQPWRDSLGRMMGEYGRMELVRRKAFLTGVEFASASIHLAAVNTEKTGARNAADAFRHLAATIGGAALNLAAMERPQKSKRRGRR